MDTERLTDIIPLFANGLGPAYSREHVAAVVASLTEIAALPGANVPVYAMEAAWKILRQEHHTDDTPTKIRRDLLRTLYAQVPDFATGFDTGLTLTQRVEAAHPYYQAQIDAWSESEDPRHQAMARRAAMELDDLRVRLAVLTLGSD